MCALIAGIIMIPAMILNHGYFALSNDFSARGNSVWNADEQGNQVGRNLELGN